MANWKKVALSGEIVNADLTGSAAISSANLANTAVTAAAYTNSSITVNAQGQITSASSGSASGDANQNAFSNVAVSGQVTAAADSATDTLTLVAAGGMTITTSGDAITLSSTTVADTQDLSLSGDTITLVDGGNVDISGATTVAANAVHAASSHAPSGAEANVSGNSGNAAIYDNSGTPAFKTGVTKAELQTLLNVADGANAYSHSTNANMTGHVTSSGNAAVLGAFTVAQLSTALSDASISGNNSGDQTVAYASAISEGNSGLVPSAGTSGHFLKHNGEFGIPAYTSQTSANVSTTVSWTGGTTAGPTLVTDGQSSAIPIASASASGVVTNANQTFAGTKTFAAVTVSGNLVVSGTTITSSTETLLISDNSMVLNSDLSTSTDVDAGIVVERGTTHDNALFYWDEGSDRWMVGTNDQADINTSKTYGGDVGQILIDGGATSGSVSGVPIGHLHYNAGILSVRVAD